MSKPLALLHAGLVTRAAPPAYRPPEPAPAAPPSAEVTPIRPWLAPRVLPLRPTRVEVEPAPVSLAATPLPVKSRRRRATTLRLDPLLYARLRVAREQLNRSGQAILVEALDNWLRKHEQAD